MDRLFSFFFKYKSSIFSKGQLELSSRPSLTLALIILLIICALIYFLYFRPGTKLDSVPRISLAALRTALIAVLALILMRPSLVVSSVIPKANTLAVVADDSRSMQINDEGTITRLQAVKDLLKADSKFSKGVEEKFKTNLYKFSSDATRLKESEELKAEGSSSDIAGTLQQVVKDASGTGLAAVVLI